MTTRPRRAFASIIAIGLLFVVTAVIGAMTMVSRTDVARTRAEIDEAQARQLLLAATTRVHQSLQAGEPMTFAAPHELSDANVKIAPIQRTDTVATFLVTARVGAATQAQTITFGHDQSWTLQSAELD